MKLDLETLKQVKFTFELHSDHSTNCNGYRRLCEMIIEAEKEALQQTAVEWLYNHLFPTKLDASTEEEWNKIDAIFEQAKAMERQQQKDILMDIDLDLAMIEDYAKGELGNNITKLRVKIDELLNI